MAVGMKDMAIMEMSLHLVVEWTNELVLVVLMVSR